MKNIIILFLFILSFNTLAKQKGPVSEMIYVIDSRIEEATSTYDLEHPTLSIDLTGFNTQQFQTYYKNKNYSVEINNNFLNFDLTAEIKSRHKEVNNILYYVFGFHLVVIPLLFLFTFLSGGKRALREDHKFIIFSSIFPIFNICVLGIMLWSYIPKIAYSIKNKSKDKPLKPKLNKSIL